MNEIQIIKHNNTTTLTKTNYNPGFIHLLHHLAWKQTGTILKGKHKGEVNKKVNNQKKKQARY